jgi:hypothetical protein
MCNALLGVVDGPHHVLSREHNTNRIALEYNNATESKVD